MKKTQIQKAASALSKLGNAAKWAKNDTPEKRRACTAAATAKRAHLAECAYRKANPDMDGDETVAEHKFAKRYWLAATTKARVLRAKMKKENK